MRPADPENDPFVKISIHTPGYTAKIILYFFFGMVDAIWQITAYWLMGAMSNDPAKLAHMSGICTLPASHLLRSRRSQY